MTGFVVFSFVLAGVLVLMGVTDQRRLHRRTTAWRYRNPEAHEPSDVALVLQRVVLFVVAAGLVISGISLWRTDAKFDDENAWSNDELRTAVKKAAANLGPTVVIEGEDTSEDHASDIADRVGSAAGDQAPSYDVDVERAEDGGDRYEITADGADAVFCMTVYRTESSGTPYVVPGTPAGSDADVKTYGLKGRVKSGAC